MGRFENKVVLVTGGNRNTGLWLVKKFVDEGAKVFMCGSSEASTAKGIESLKVMLGSDKVMLGSDKVRAANDSLKTLNDPDKTPIASKATPADASETLKDSKATLKDSKATLEDSKATLKDANETLTDARVIAQACDVGNREQVAALMDLIEKEAGTLDILINNAADQGLGHGGPLEMDPDLILKVMGTNVRGGFQVTQAACNRFFMKKPYEVGGAYRGTVVFLSSNTAQRAIRGRTAYCASKGAINSMVRALALDLAPLGIRVNACAPGYIYTERWDVLDPKIAARRRANCPLGREAKGADIANVVAFLASEDSGNMAGEIVTCDAGCSCQHMPKDVDF